MVPPPDTIDRAFELMKAGYIETLVSNAADAFVAGEVRASRQLGIGLNFSLINSRAVSLTRAYRETLERFGGSDITVVDEAGRISRQFKPWLNDMIKSDREIVGKIIENGQRTGDKRQMELALEDVFKNRGHSAVLVARTETKALYTKGTMQRFAHENVQQGRWVHMDPQQDPREDHQALDGKVFYLDDPVWDLLNEPNCHCWCEPVIVGRTAISSGEEVE